MSGDYVMLLDKEVNMDEKLPEGGGNESDSSIATYTHPCCACLSFSLPSSPSCSA